MIITSFIIGMAVIIKSDTVTEYNGCTGILTKIEHIPEIHETITVVKPVICPNGNKYDYIVGLRLEHLVTSSKGEK